MEFKNILMTTDLSPYSLSAKDISLSLARKYRAKLYLLYVIDEMIFVELEPYGIAYQDIQVTHREQAEQKLKEIVSGEEWKDIRCEPVIITGNPFVEIIRFAKEKQIDVIVIGTHGRSGLSHILFGSTAERVIRKAPCPVLSVRISEHHFEMP